MKIQHILIVLSIIILSSCSGQDFLSVEEDSGIIPFSTAPTITAFLCPQDTVHKVVLTYTRPVVGKNTSQEWAENVGKAIVTLSNAEQTVTLKSGGNQSSNFTIKAKDFKVEAGKTYRLNVTTYDGQKAEAVCTIPLNKVDVQKADTKEVADDKFQGKKYLITWQDIPDEVNYYAISVFQKDVNPTYVRVGSDYTENSITDVGINGGQMSSKKSFFMSKRQNFGDWYRVTEIQILNTDINFYRFQKDLEILTISGDNPLVEPINIYSNIKGGFGVFAGYNRARGIFN
jgi:hypothetical protein